jgi:hypothetical protein
MGSIARIGIFSGKPVPVGDIPGHRSPAVLSEFARACLGRFGFARIAERVALGQSLTVRDVEMLLSKASLPVLMKLVEIRHRTEEWKPPLPLVVLPLSNWTSRFSSTRVLELSQDLLRSIRHKNLRVVIDRIQYDQLDADLVALLKEISSCRPGMTLVGPSVDDVLAWAVSVSGTGEPLDLRRLERMLHRLREAGLGRLMPSTMADVLSTVRAAGFPASLVTNVADFESPLELAKELLRVNEVASQMQIDVWVPGFELTQRARSNQQLARSAVDFELLRVLAVGTLCMDSVPYRRVSTRYFSVDAIQFARYCGANDFGFGAVNELTAKAMHLERLDRLKRAVPSHRQPTAGSEDPLRACPFPRV